MIVPRHIALIPDGNRRWANEHGLKPWDGHRVGIERFREFIDWCYDLGVEQITAYTLSKENLNGRAPTEIKFLFKLYEINLMELLNSPKLVAREVKVEFAGNLEPFPKRIGDLISEVEYKTKGFKKCNLTLCVNYSGRGEILRAIRGLVESGKPINEKNLEANLQIKSPPDLLIRTAERRMSNFLLWQLAYSEMYFSPKLFPDFTKKDLMCAIEQYNSTKRRFGK
jgi:undecaprenyl diphosphate synthase